jgi:adenylylsulfate kinase
MDTYKEGHLRSILKAISYRTCAAIATATIVFIFTRKFVLSVGVGLVEAIVKIIFYYLHERIWSFINIGKKEHPLSSLRIDQPLNEEDMKIIKNKLKDLGYISDD